MFRMCRIFKQDHEMEIERRRMLMTLALKLGKLDANLNSATS